VLLLLLLVLQQVQAAVLCAVNAKVRPVPRSGGNSFEALSTGDGVLVIDLADLAGECHRGRVCIEGRVGRC
jgi:hypothetical protein